MRELARSVVDHVAALARARRHLGDGEQRLLGGVPGVAPGEVVVIGGGMVGYNAAVIALGLGANVTILERSIDRMRRLEEVLGARVTLLMSSSLQIEESVADRECSGLVVLDFLITVSVLSHLCLLRSPPASACRCPAG